MAFQKGIHIKLIEACMASFIGYTGEEKQLFAFFFFFKQLKLISPGSQIWKLIPELMETGLSGIIRDRDGIFTSSLTDYGGV